MKTAKKRFILILLLLSQVIESSEHIFQSRVPDDSRNRLEQQANEFGNLPINTRKPAPHRNLIAKVIEKHLADLSGQRKLPSSNEPTSKEINLNNHIFRDFDTCGCPDDQDPISSPSLVLMTYDSLIKRLSDMETHYNSFSIAGWQIASLLIEKEDEEEENKSSSDEKSLVLNIELYSSKDSATIGPHSIKIKISSMNSEVTKNGNKAENGVIETEPPKLLRFERKIDQKNFLQRTCALASEIAKKAFGQVAIQQFLSENPEKRKNYFNFAFDWCKSGARYLSTARPQIINQTDSSQNRLLLITIEILSIRKSEDINRDSSQIIPESSNQKGQNNNSSQTSDKPNFSLQPSGINFNNNIRNILNRHFGLQIPFTRVLEVEIIEIQTSTVSYDTFDHENLWKILNSEECPFNLESLCRKFSFIRRLPRLIASENKTSDLSLKLANGFTIKVILTESGPTNSQHCVELELLMLQNSVNQIACWQAPEVPEFGDTISKDHPSALIFHEVIERIYILSLLAETAYHWQISQLDIMRAIINARKDSIDEISKIIFVEGSEVVFNTNSLPEVNNDFANFEMITESASLVALRCKIENVTFTIRIDSGSDRYHYVRFVSLSQQKELLIPKSIEDLVQDLTGESFATFSRFDHVETFIDELTKNMEGIKLLSLQNRFANQVVEFIASVRATHFDLKDVNNQLGD